MKRKTGKGNNTTHLFYFLFNMAVTLSNNNAILIGVYEVLGRNVDKSNMYVCNYVYILLALARKSRNLQLIKGDLCIHLAVACLSSLLLL